MLRTLLLGVFALSVAGCTANLEPTASADLSGKGEETEAAGPDTDELAKVAPEKKLLDEIDRIEAAWKAFLAAPRAEVVGKVDQVTRELVTDAEAALTDARSVLDERHGALLDTLANGGGESCRERRATIDERCWSPADDDAECRKSRDSLAPVCQDPSYLLSRYVSLNEPTSRGMLACIVASKFFVENAGLGLGEDDKEAIDAMQAGCILGYQITEARMIAETYFGTDATGPGNADSLVEPDLSALQVPTHIEGLVRHNTGQAEGWWDYVKGAAGPRCDALLSLSPVTGRDAEDLTWARNGCIAKHLAHTYGLFTSPRDLLPRELDPLFSRRATAPAPAN